jgi:hypothetical protein
MPNKPAKTYDCRELWKEQENEKFADDYDGGNNFGMDDALFGG